MNSSKFPQSAPLSPDASLQKRSGNLLIHPRFQLTLILYALLIALISVGIFFFTFQALFGKLMDLGIQAKLDAADPFFDFVTQQKVWMQQVFFFASISLLTSISFLGLWVSHRIAGPMVRLKNFLDQMVETQKMSELRFRKNDYFSDLAESLNQALKILQKQSKTDSKN